MNEKTQAKLEFDKIKSQLMDYTYFDGGKKEISKFAPSDNYLVVESRLDETSEAMELIRYGEPAFLSRVKLIDELLAKARISSLLAPQELIEIYFLLSASRSAKKMTDDNKYKALQKYGSQLIENRELEIKIIDAISEDGEVKDSASPVLYTIRRQINTYRLRIKEYLNQFIRSENNQKYLQEALVTERDGRYVVPVRQEHRYDVKGILHDESSSGATVFIEPMPVVEHNNKIRGLQAEEKREVERILRELSQAVTYEVEALAVNLQLLSTLDHIFARARMAYKTNAFRPRINEQGIIDISRARHPLLGASAVPVDIKLGKDFDILIITGPNTGGKTVVLKTLGLLTVMTMSGLFIPAMENSMISIFDFIFADIGDEQSIEQSLSTFSSHMTNIIGILEAVNDKSLVLLDELGAGTDPAEGAALARVIMEELMRKKVKAVVTTHQSELKYFAYQNERVENACVEFDPIKLYPTYKLTIGMPGQSNAFQIAQRLGLDKQLVQRAKKLMPEREMEIGQMLTELKEKKYKYENTEKQIAVTRDKLMEEKAELTLMQQRILEERGEILEKTRLEANEYLKRVKDESNQAIQELKELLKDKENPPKWHEVEKARQKLKKIDINREEGKNQDSYYPGEIKPGDYVLIKNIKQKGFVVEGPNKQGEVIVQAGILKLTVKLQELVKTESEEEKTAKIRHQTYLEKARYISKEIDLRGKNAEEALEIIERYLEDARLVNLDSVRLIHGKGTGALRLAVRNYLNGHYYVKSYRDGLPEEGGHGVTVVELN
ncbi:MAG TPA: endonuclease MutS2 [Syntrophomonadaceae bacterium]|nr:endonuclease MutS2 [Syntrophomonadaceae bacterium]HPR94112.1 endonuclease MutS2 [Syntrophomonadaceae bacterium]